MSSDTWTEYRAFTRSVAVYDRKRALEYLALGLSSEAGEFAGLVSRTIRGDRKIIDREEAALELGDVLWFLDRAAAELGFTLAQIRDMNRGKLASRKRRGVIRGSGGSR